VGNTTKILNPHKKSSDKEFNFDYSYWSHDGYQERDDGYLEPNEGRYADQARVFNDLGKGVLDNAWKGFNCSLFAYGQTGSGKSYSMVGNKENKGIIPTACEHLFKVIENKKANDDERLQNEYQVSVSMLEIYNEQVKDLLNVKSFKKGGLKVREHPNKGFYAEGLQVSPVSSYEDIETRISEGTRNRTLASTNMNATSSRAHTIVSINFVQKGVNQKGKNMTKTSVINLVDLAGSERADSTGAVGNRLKEGAMINMSLSCLGNCVKAVADIQSGKINVRIPFRDSVLTRLLKNALGGNSKTVMIAALSPADINYDETLSTLRFANRAKSIKTKAVVNESPTDRLIREMKGEIERLKGLLENQSSVASSPVTVVGVSQEEVESMKKQQLEELKRNEEEMENMKRTWQQRLEAEKQESERKLAEERNRQEAKKTTPYLWNLSEDPLLTGMVVHFIPNGKCTLGNKEKGKDRISMQGLGIQKNHAYIENIENNKISLKIVDEESKVLVNGKEVEKTGVELHHNDRILFGTNQLYVFHHPQDAAQKIKEGKSVEKISFDSAQEEIAKNKGFDMEKSGKSSDEILLQEDLIQTMPMVSEANAMSEELDMKMFYEIVLISPQARGLNYGRTKVHIIATNLINGNEFMWDKDEFTERKYAMQEIYHKYFEDGNDDPDVINARVDYPFQIDKEPDVLIGSCFLYLQSLCYMMDFTDKLNIRNYKGDSCGLADVQLAPLDKDGYLLIDECVENTDMLLGKPLEFVVKINKLLGIQLKYKKIWCKYKSLMEEKWCTSNKVKGQLNPEFNFSQTFKTSCIDNQLIEELNMTPITIQVWGTQKNKKIDENLAKLSTKELIALKTGKLLPTNKNELTESADADDLASNSSDVEHLKIQLQKIIKEKEDAEKLNRKIQLQNNLLNEKYNTNQKKLDLIQTIVDEANANDCKTVMVTRIDHILKKSEDLSKEALEKIKINILTETEVVKDLLIKQKANFNKSQNNLEISNNKLRYSKRTNKKKSIICTVL